MRYTDPETNEIHMFPDNFERAEIDPELIFGEDLEEAILDSIEEAAKKGSRTTSHSPATTPKKEPPQEHS